MPVAPIAPQTPHARPTHRAAAPAAATKARAAKEPATPEDLEALAQQRMFDSIAAAQAEQQREMNVLRDLAMAQVKRDDQVVNDWIRLI